MNALTLLARRLGLSQPSLRKPWTTDILTSSGSRYRIVDRGILSLSVEREMSRLEAGWTSRLETEPLGELVYNSVGKILRSKFKKPRIGESLIFEDQSGREVQTSLIREITD